AIKQLLFFNISYRPKGTVKILLFYAFRAVKSPLFQIFSATVGGQAGQIIQSPPERASKCVGKPIRKHRTRWPAGPAPGVSYLPLCGGQVIGPCPAGAPVSSARAGCCPIHGGGQRPRSGQSQTPSCPGKTARKYAGLGWRAAASAPHTLPLAAASAPGFPPG